MGHVISRRTVVGAAGTIAGAAFGLVKATAAEPIPRVQLRLLETSDLHMFVLDWDYFRAKTDAGVGFAKVATLIRSARAEKANVLLFDNGDFLQGNPLGDYIAGPGSDLAAGPHPIVRIMADLGTDAAGLGNHEFNYGVPFLETSLRGASFPFVCANVTRAGGAEFLPASVILERGVIDDVGMEHRLRIGVIGFVPPQIMMWDKSRLDGKLEAGDMVRAAQRLVPGLRQRCDLIVALCHSGIRGGAWEEGMENAALHVAAVPGIDVIMTGHSHRVFPGKDYLGIDGVDAVAGRLHGVPAVMPGFWGSHLGVVDLSLVRADGRWTVENASVETRPIATRAHGTAEPLVASDPGVKAAIAVAHAATLAWVEQPVGAIDAPVQSYLVWAAIDPATAIVNASQSDYARALLAGSDLAALPLLSAAAPFRAGYTAESFIDIAPGVTSLRQIADIYLYSNNTISIVKVTGADLREWLEYAARAFLTIDPAVSDPQPLVDRRIPSYSFDTIAGLTYAIDVTQPPRYDKAGTINADAHRIVDLQYAGAPIDMGQQFLVVTNNYRADGGGGFPGLKHADVVVRAPDSNQEALLRYFRARQTVSVPKGSPWRFAPAPGQKAVYFDTGKSVATLLDATPWLRPVGEGEPGFLRVGFTLPV